MAWFENDPGAVNVRGGILGPMTGSQKAAMLFAGLRDAVGNFSGRPTENLNQLAEQYGQQNYRQQVRQDRLSDKADEKARLEQARKDQMETALSPEEALARGYRPGAVVYRNGLGIERLGQASDLKSAEAIRQQIEIDQGKGVMSPAEMQQRLQLAAAGRSDAGGGSVVIQPGGQLVSRATGQPIYTAPKKPMPATMQAAETADIDAIQTARAGIKDMDVIRKQLDTGGTKLGPITTPAANALNWSGYSNENSRRVGTLKATLEKKRNDSLRLNKGVQTDGDASRAWNELLNGPLNDAKFVSQRLAEIQEIDRRGAMLRADQLHQRRMNYGQDEFDESKLNPSAALGTTGTTGAAQAQTPPSITPAEARAELERRRRARGGR